MKPAAARHTGPNPNSQVKEKGLGIPNTTIDVSLGRPVEKFAAVVLHWNVRNTKGGPPTLAIADAGWIDHVSFRQGARPRVA